MVQEAREATKPVFLASLPCMDRAQRPDQTQVFYALFPAIPWQAAPTGWSILRRLPPLCFILLARRVFQHCAEVVCPGGCFGGRICGMPGGGYGAAVWVRLYYHQVMLYCDLSCQFLIKLPGMARKGNCMEQQISLAGLCFPVCGRP